MTLPVYPGPISLSQIQAEFGGSNPLGLDEYYAGATPELVPPGTVGYPTGAGSVPIPSSGTISLANFFGASAALTYTVFTSSGNYIVPSGKSVIYLWMVGGGAGGSNLDLTSLYNYGAGGGGAGQVLQSTSYAVIAGQNLTITIGAGGAPSTNGTSSIVSGGTGGTVTATYGLTAGNGNVGGNSGSGQLGATGFSSSIGGGGGGQTGAGTGGNLITTSGGEGGAGVTFTLNSITYIVSGGGGGGIGDNNAGEPGGPGGETTAGTGGTGGFIGTNATVNRGGGGGGGTASQETEGGRTYTNGTNGGSGIIIIGA